MDDDLSPPTDEMVHDETGIDSLLKALDRAFSALGDDPDYLADLVASRAGDLEAEKLRDLFQVVGQLIDARQAEPTLS